MWTQEDFDALSDLSPDYKEAIDRLSHLIDDAPFDSDGGLCRWFHDKRDFLFDPEWGHLGDPMTVARDWAEEIVEVSKRANMLREDHKNWTRVVVEVNAEGESLALVIDDYYVLCYSSWRIWNFRFLELSELARNIIEWRDTIINNVGKYYGK